MSRLTEKLDDGHLMTAHHKDGHYRPADFHTSIQCYNKLGMLEDIEDELGCPIETVYKALSDGIWIKCQVPLYRDELIHVMHLVLFQGKFIEVQKAWHFHKRAPENGDDDDYYYFALSDYGKTWALTKEELQ